MRWSDLLPGDVIASVESELVSVVVTRDGRRNLHLNLRSGKTSTKHRLKRPLPPWFEVLRGSEVVQEGRLEEPANGAEGGKVGR